jgi:hypothetical protein
MISTSTLVAIEFLAFFGGLLWFGWRQSKLMERSIAEDTRRAAEAERADG